MRYEWICLRCRREFIVAPADKGKLLPKCTRCGTTDCTVVEEPEFMVAPIPEIIDVDIEVIEPRRIS